MARCGQVFRQLSLDAALALWGTLSLALWGFPSAAVAGEGGSGEPSFVDVRTIQYEYSPTESLLVVEWKVTGGAFLDITVSVDNGPRTRVAGGSGGVSIERLLPGLHEVRVAGAWKGGEKMKRVFHMVLEASPVERVIPLECIFFGFDPRNGKGFLEVSWIAPQRPDDDPYQEYEVTVDGGRFWRLDAPDTAVTFSDIEEGVHEVEITGVTRHHVSPPASLRCRAEGIAPPEDVRLTTGCREGQGAATVSYRIPPGTRYDSVAVWLSGPEGRDFRGYHPPGLREIDLPGLFDGAVEVEVAGARFERGGDSPFSISSLPGRPGKHAVATGRIRCQGPFEFRRGDFSDDGRVNMTDAVRVLNHLFVGGVEVSCLAAADIDDGGEVDISDGVVLLLYLFAGGAPPAPPGPRTCGEDPTPGDLGECLSEACSG